MYKLFFSQKWRWLIFGFWATIVKKWNFQNIVLLYTVRLQVFFLSKIQKQVKTKNENLKSYKKKCYNHLNVWVHCIIITNFRGLEMYLTFGIFGVFLICFFFFFLDKRFWVLLKGKCSTGVALYVNRVFDCFLEASGIHSTRHLVFGRTFTSIPLSSYDLCICYKILSIKIALLPCLTKEEVTHILFSKDLNVTSNPASIRHLQGILELSWNCLVSIRHFQDA